LASGVLDCDPSPVSGQPDMIPDVSELQGHFCPFRGV
jgi:hypothetical protein